MTAVRERDCSECTYDGGFCDYHLRQRLAETAEREPVRDDLSGLQRRGNCANCGAPDVLYDCPCGLDVCPCAAGVCRRCKRHVAKNTRRAGGSSEAQTQTAAEA